MSTSTEKSHELIRTLDAIHKVLDGRYWSPDTLEQIASLLRRAGYDIRSPEDIEGGREMTQRRIRMRDDRIEVNVEGRIYRPVAVAINGGQILLRPDRQGLVIETDSFIHMHFDPEVVIL